MNRLEDLGRRTAAEQDDALVDVQRRASVRRRVLASATQRRGHLLAWAAAAVALFALVALLVPRTRAVTFTVAGVSARAGAWVSAPAECGVELRFSDGTVVDLDRGTRARVTSVEAAGAHVLVESGAIEAKVVHRAHASWHFLAGPFDVLVTGTAFRLAWDPASTQFSITMHEGSVVVSGGAAGAGQAVSSGESLIADAARSTLERSSAPVSAPTVASVVEEPSVAPSSPSPPAPSIKSPTWRALAADGKYADALASAEKAGFANLCASLAAGDVYQLGDVARLARNHGRAIEAFIAVRRRFPSDARAAHAAFALGRVAFDGKSAYAEAATWFETYLREQPSGAFAREAAGRLVEAHQRSGATASARSAAQRYLAAYPDGPHAGLAKSVVTAAP